MKNKKTTIISLEEAKKIAFNNCNPLITEKVDFKDSVNRILAEDIYSDTDLPPFNKSAMDGYACRKEDINNELKVLEIISAGISPTFTITKNCCSKIMTGAEVPKGADIVLMIEDTQETDKNTIRFVGTKMPSHICLKGEDLKKGSLVLSKGTLLKPQHIAIMASVGCNLPKLAKQPNIGIISTGSELIEPDELLASSKIRNSNGHQMVSQSIKYGYKTKYYGIVKDDLQLTYDIISKSSNENDLTIISGGVSVGDFDYVPEAIEKAGFNILFDKVSVKPGQHTTFALRKDSKNGSSFNYIIGLPGNPVSSFIQFEVFVKPFLNKLQGREEKEISIPFSLAHDIKRKKTDRTVFLPVIINSENKVELAKYNGSAHIHAYHNAFGFIMIETDIKEIKKGEIVYVRPL